MVLFWRILFCAGLAVIAGVCPVRASGPFPHLPSAGQVIAVRHPDATRAYTPRPEAIRQMVEHGLLRVTGADSATQAWRGLISSDDVVGIKVHSAPGRNSGTRLPVVIEVVESLLAAGIPASQIVVWDRRRSDLRLAGFLVLEDRYGISVEGSLETGYDPDHFYTAPLLGRLVHGDLDFGTRKETAGRNSYISRLLTRRITKIVNITPLLNHNRVGVSGILWGLAFGSVDNTLRFDFDPERLATAIPEIVALPEIYDRVVLNIVDALICQYQGEERTLLHFSTALNELWFSKDPVALDVLAIEKLQEERRAADSPEVRVNQAIYQNAALLQLGFAERRRISVERVDLANGFPAK